MAPSLYKHPSLLGSPRAIALSLMYCTWPLGSLLSARINFIISYPFQNFNRWNRDDFSHNLNDTDNSGGCMKYFIGQYCIREVWFDKKGARAIQSCHHRDLDWKLSFKSHYFSQ